MGVFYKPPAPIYPHLPPAFHRNYRTPIDKEKPTICYQTWAFIHLKISMDYQVVPEAGLEPAQGCPRGILSPLRLPIPPLRRRLHCKTLHEDLASRQMKKPATDPRTPGLLAGFSELFLRRRRRIALSQFSLTEADGRPGSRKAERLAPPCPQVHPHSRVHPYLRVRPQNRAGFVPRRAGLRRS